MTWYFILGWLMIFVPIMMEIKERTPDTWTPGFKISSTLYVAGVLLLLGSGTWAYGWGLIACLYMLSSYLFWHHGMDWVRLSVHAAFILTALGLTWHW